MRDYDQVPPKDFQWFYQSGGDLDHLYFVWVPDGTDPSAQHIPFDEKDFLSATTWASYRDTDGKKHFVSKDFAYDSTENDLKIVSSLLKFNAGNRKEDAVINKFLESLQVCPKGHYSRFGLLQPYELWG